MWFPFFGPRMEEIYLPHTLQITGRLRGVGALRELARVSLRLRRERIATGPSAADPLRWLASDEDAAFHGLPLEVATLENGRLRLELSGAEELFPKLGATPPFRWEIP